MNRHRRKAMMGGLLAALVLAVAIVIGSGNLAHFDIALLGYTVATLFAAFAVTYRWLMWLQRPPTVMYWRRLGGPNRAARGSARFLLRSLTVAIRCLIADFVANRFIWRRGRLRGFAHGCIMWGCISAVAITFPLVFGWVHFETVPGDLASYSVHVFDCAIAEFPIVSLLGFMIFYALVWSSLLVVAGATLALIRRLRDRGAAALQQFGEDFLPLLLLLAVSVSGLMLTVSSTWLRGMGHEFLAFLHAAAVIFALLWLPFGKLFHVFMRPAHLLVAVYKDAGRTGERAYCRRCGEAYASARHVADLLAVERQLGYRYEIDETRHYQEICPPCRRALVCLAHADLWETPSPFSREPQVSAALAPSPAARG